MTMAPGLRKFALTAHLTFSVGFIGAAVAYLALGISAVTSEDAQTVRAAWIAMELIGWYVIVPLSLPALLGPDHIRADHLCHRNLAAAHAECELSGRRGARGGWCHSRPAGR
jgi:hypothetical protein